MHRLFLRKVKKQMTEKYRDIDPEDIFLDSANLPGFAEHRFEGRMEKPMGARTFFGVKLVLILVVIFLGSRLWSLGVKDGPLYAEISENNRLSQTVIFANRGVIYDRNGVELATNDIKDEESDFAGRVYSPLIKGVSHVVGYVKYPLADSSGNYYEVNYRGRDGVERMYDHVLKGSNGLKLLETDARGTVTSESIIDPPKEGGALNLSVDAMVSDQLYNILATTIEERGFEGGAGVIMDVNTGEILALVSAPEYDQNVITSGQDSKAISGLLNDPSKPFLNRVTAGLYVPGSIIKPILALAALNEGLISPSKKILSTGSISIPNPYFPDKPSVFGDWKAHGWTDMREAIAVSSDVYFYSIGGGYGDQKGLGIERIDKYLNLFGLTESTGIDLFGELSGTIPTPEWKKANFNGDVWRLGDTYITSIGQYGSLVTPLESVRFVAAIANKGKLLVPSVLKGGLEVPKERIAREIKFSEGDWKVVQEGMRAAATIGTASALNVPYVKVAAKTGTAEVGVGKNFVHSWSVGYFPYENPRYAFAILMEKGPSNNAVGASSIMRQLLDWMSVNAPQYFE
jgi:penicillin-binding protein 2